VTPTADGSIFSMTSEAGHLVRLRKWLRDERAGHGVRTEEQSNLPLAAGELCANSIQHTHEDQGGQPIQVSARSSADSLQAWAPWSPQ